MWVCLWSIYGNDSSFKWCKYLPCLASANIWCWILTFWYCFFWFADIDPERSWRSTLGLPSFWHLKWWITTLCHSQQTCGVSASSLTCCRFKSRDKWHQIHKRACCALKLKLTFTFRILKKIFPAGLFHQAFCISFTLKKRDYIETYLRMLLCLGNWILQWQKKTNWHCVFCLNWILYFWCCFWLLMSERSKRKCKCHRNESQTSEPEAWVHPLIL